MPDPHAHLIDTTDAREWAKAFCTTFKGEVVGDPADTTWAYIVDEGLLLAWFANAIETGRRAGEAKTLAYVTALREEAERVLDLAEDEQYIGGQRLAELVLGITPTDPNQPGVGGG